MNLTASNYNQSLMKISFLAILIILFNQGIAQENILGKQLSKFFLNIPINLHPSEAQKIMTRNSHFEITKFEDYDDYGNSSLEAIYNGNYSKYNDVDSISFKRRTFPVAYSDPNKEIKIKIISQSTLQLLFLKRKQAKEQFTLMLEQMKIELPTESIKVSEFEHRDFNSTTIYLAGNKDFDMIVLSFKKLSREGYYAVEIVNH